jgi:NodT family efflux transporter outer membrane factor (OMF) lipoprotein
MSRFISLVSVAIALAGCAVGPDYKPPSAVLTASYHNTPAAPVAPASKALAQDWWIAFNDPELTRMIEHALAQNLSLAAAKARLQQARASARAAGAALLPSLDATGSAASIRQSLDGPIGTIGRHLPGFSRDTDDYTLGIGASWEVDLFGGLKREREAARAAALASAAETAAVRLAVEADVADAYLQVRSFQARIGVAQGQLEIQTDLLALVKRRFGEGVSAEREVRQVEAAREAVEAAIPPLRRDLEAQLNRLEILTGVQPGTLHRELEREAPIPTLTALPDFGTLGDLLRRRPDLIAAEARLRASNARIGAAIAQYYPRLSLTGLIGVDSLRTGTLFDDDAQQSQLALGLRWRLFDFGRIDAEVATAKGRDAEALANYRLAVLKAAGEVEDALAGYIQEQTHALALQRQIQALTVARGQIGKAYDEGAASLIEVRDADRNLLLARDQLVQADAAIARAAVASFRALGA